MSRMLQKIPEYFQRLPLALGGSTRHTRDMATQHLEALQRKLADTRRRVRTLIVIGMRPNLSDDKREIVRELERSARAEVKLRLKALEYAKTKSR